MRALRRLSADEFLDELLGRKFYFGDESCTGLDFAGAQLFLLSPAGEKAIVPNLRKSSWQNVHQETSDEFIGLQRHDLVTAAISVIPPLKSNSTIFNL